jgi:hypothetical protein
LINRVNLEEYNKRDRDNDEEKDGIYPEGNPVKFYWVHRPYHRMMTRREVGLPETSSIAIQLTINSQVTQAIRVVKDYCAMGRGAKKAEDGRQALVHGTYPRGAMTAQNVGEEDIQNVRTVLGANDIHAANMMDIDIDAIGFRALRGIRRRPREQRERKRFCISDRRRRKAKSKKLSKKKGPTTGLEPTWV